MDPRKRALVLGCLVFWAWTGTSPARGDVLRFVDWEGEWSYRPGTSEPTSPDLGAWRQLEFDASNWATGNGIFGFGRNPPYGTDLSLLTPPMRNNYSTLYLRRVFNVRDVDRVGEVRLRVLYDDAVVVWINGQEVTRYNTVEEAGTHIPFDGVASRSVNRGNEEELALEHTGLLQTGANVIAVHLLNSGLTNSDLRFALELRDVASPDFQEPSLELIVPAPETSVGSLTRVQVLFDEPVLGVEASDLLVAGVPATDVAGSGAGPYRFDVIEPAPGTVTINWSADAGITDAALDRNPFAGGSWNVVLDPTTPPPDVIISEFMAANGITLRDEDADTPDWVEIWNRGENPIHLAGWSLTDSVQELDRFIFPADSTLDGGARLIVFASRKNRVVSGGELHTSFSLSDGGEFLGLFNAEFPREAASIFTSYPRQRYDHSYGVTVAGEKGFFGTPTPGEPNAEEVFDGFASQPRFSVQRGFYDEGFDLELTVADSHQIVYTLDGSDPRDELGRTYTGPIPIDGSAERGVVFVRAASIREGLLPSRVVTHSYLFADHILTQPANPEGFPERWGTQKADYELNPEIIEPARDMALDGLTSIPTLSIVTATEDLFDRSRGVYANPSRSGPSFERPVSAELIYADGERDFQVDCGIRSQGGSSTSDWKSRKVSMRLLFKGRYGFPTLDEELYPDYPVRRFNTLVLDAGLNLTLNHPGHDQRIRTQNIRDQFVADLQNESGGYAPRSFFVNLYLNGLHWGMYGLHERPDAFWAAENFGGVPEGYDAMRHQSTNVVDGSSQSYRAVMSLLRMDLNDPANYEIIGKALDVDDLIQYMIVNLYSGNTDWAHQNWYATLSANGTVPLRYHSWDAEHVLKGVGDNVVAKNDLGGPTGVFSTLRRSSEFRRQFADSVHEHFFNGGVLYVNPESPAWDPRAPQNNRPASVYMRRVREVETAILLEYARWGDNFRQLTYTRKDWLAELDFLVSDYFPRRSAVVLKQLASTQLYPNVPAPVFSQHGGEVVAGSPIVMTLPPDEVLADSRVILYTIDGTDPRTPFTGAIAASAIEYTAPLSLSESGLLQARTLTSDADSAPLWSALNKATFQTISARPPLIVISELMYNPLASDTSDGSELEFVEFFNPGSESVDLSGMAFTRGIRFTFPAGSSLGAGSYGVVVANAEAFAERYGDAATDPSVLLGRYMGQLNNDGDRLELADSDGETMASLRYNDGAFWPLGADGLGYSLVPTELSSVDADLDDPRAWRQSAEMGGSPGTTDAEPVHGDIDINEISTLAGGSIELWNRGSAAVDVGGWFLGDGLTEEGLKRHRLAQISVPGNGYAVIDQSSFGTDLVLNPLGGALFLASASGETLTGHVVRGRYDPPEADNASLNAVSFGRYESSTSLEFVPLSKPTLGADNAPPMPPQIAINEVYYNPHVGAPLAGDSEFVELLNVTDERVEVGGWRVDGLTGVAEDAFIFPDGAGIRAGGFLLLVRIDPDDYRQDYPAPDAVVVGPYNGALNNAGEGLILSRPVADGAFAVVDRVVYNDREPWPIAADGGGPSLERANPERFGNDVLNWRASTADGGTPGAANSSDVEDETGRQVPGDLNQDGRLNLVDAIDLLRHLSGHEPFRLPCGEGVLSDAGNTTLLDANGDTRVDLSDAVQLLRFLFQRGTEHASGMGCVTMATCPKVCAP